MSDKQVPISLKVSPSLHPDNVTTLDSFKDDHTRGFLSPALDAFEHAYKRIQAVFDAREALLKDRTRTPESVVLEISAFAQKHQDVVTRKFDAAYSQFTISITAIEKSLAAPVREVAELKSISAEVRAFVKGLSTEQRYQWFEDAFRRQDHDSLRAVLGGPAFLSGASEKEKEVRTQQYHRAAQPELAQRLKVLSDARDLICERGQLVFAEMRKAVGENHERIRRLRDLADKAADSLKFA